MTMRSSCQGYPHWHQEVRLDDNPVEAGLLFTCKLKTSTDFLGRTRLQQIRNQLLYNFKLFLILACDSLEGGRWV